MVLTVREKVGIPKDGFDLKDEKVSKMVYEKYLDHGCFTGELHVMSMTKSCKRCKDKQYRLGIELDEHTKADHEYHIHVATVLHLAQKTKEIFQSSEVHEKRSLLNFLLQNPTVEGRKLKYSLKIPFNSILELAQNPTCTNGLAVVVLNPRDETN